MKEENKHSYTIENNKRASLYRCGKRMLSREDICKLKNEKDVVRQRTQERASKRERSLVPKKPEVGKRLFVPIPNTKSM